MSYFQVISALILVSQGETSSLIISSWTTSHPPEKWSTLIVGLSRGRGGVKCYLGYRTPVGKGGPTSREKHPRAVPKPPLHRVVRILDSLQQLRNGKRLPRKIQTYRHFETPLKL